MKNYKSILWIIPLLFLFVNKVSAQNPLITNQFTADPSARVFGDKVYIYPSHDILANKDRGRIDWFCMEDYHVFSSANLTEWTDHGTIISQNNIPWVKPDSYSMWAPDCIEKNGKYYLYFPTTPKDSTLGRGFRIGVAVADSPTGPFIPQLNPIKEVKGIDPNVFIDKDGQAYLYWSQGNIYGAKLQENMLELASEPVIFQNLPEKGLKEGPYMFERDGKYYLTFPHVENKTERLEYAMGNHPLGPFTMTGVIMDETPGCWTNHHSIINFKKQHYLFYHANDLSPNFDKARSIRADSLFFNNDGTIKKVIPSLRGIGVTKASDKIQMDRYSAISNSVGISFIDTTKKFDGWKVNLTNNKSWVSYNNVDFGKENIKKVEIRIKAVEGGNIDIRNINGKKSLANVMVAKTNNWTTIAFPVANIEHGLHNLMITNLSDHPIEIDWLSFK